MRGAAMPASGIARQGVEQQRGPARRDLGIVVQRNQHLALSRGEPDVRPAGESQVVLHHQEMHPGVLALHDRDRVIARCVVDDDDLELVEAILSRERVEARPQEVQTVPIGNDDRGLGARHRAYSPCNPPTPLARDA